LEGKLENEGEESLENEEEKFRQKRMRGKQGPLDVLPLRERVYKEDESGVLEAYRESRKVYARKVSREKCVREKRMREKRMREKCMREK